LRISAVFTIPEIPGTFHIVREGGGLIERGDGNGEVDGFEMHEGIEHRVVVSFPTVRAADDEDFRPVLLDVNDFLDAGNPLVVCKLVTAVVARGAG
jgi:hypothetical protein